MLAPSGTIAGCCPFSTLILWLQHIGRWQVSSTLVAEHTDNVISFYLGHDSNICVARHGRVQAVLELERLFDVRHFEPPAPTDSGFAHSLRQALAALSSGIVLWPTTFDVAVIVRGVAVDAIEAQLRLLVAARNWTHADHHYSHALLGLHSSVLCSAAIISYDGNGNDGSTLFYLGSRGGGVLRLSERDVSLGWAYYRMGAVCREFFRSRSDLHWAVEFENLDGLDARVYDAGIGGRAGKMMAYAAVGAPRDEWMHIVRDELLSATIDVERTWQARAQRTRASSVKFLRGGVNMRASNNKFSGIVGFCLKRAAR